MIIFQVNMKKEIHLVEEYNELNLDDYQKKELSNFNENYNDYKKKGQSVLDLS